MISMQSADPWSASHVPTVPSLHHRALARGNYGWCSPNMRRKHDGLSAVGPWMLMDSRPYTAFICSAINFWQHAA
jgi:hypothetical protein